MNNGPGNRGRKTAPPLSEDAKLKIRAMRESGMNATQIAIETGYGVQAVRLYLRKEGLSAPPGNRFAQNPRPTPTHDAYGNTLVGTEEARLSPEQIEKLTEKRLAMRAPTQPTELAERPADEEQAAKRTTELGHDILRGAERLIKSINSLSDEALAAASLHHKATALGILVDKLKVITNKAQPMFGADAGTINIVNIIASATPPRKKDQSATDAEIIEP